MTSPTRFLAAALAAAIALTSAAQDAKPDLATDAAARAADAKKAAALSDPSITETLKKAAEGAPQAKPFTTKKGGTKTNAPTDPSKWGAEETHKIAVLDVTFGGETREIMFELFENDAPRTVANFADNASSGIYNGLAVHRAIDSYLVQTGDPLTSDESARDRWGTGGEDKQIPAEIKRRHTLGAVAMARRGDAVNPGRKSNGSQFYFVLGNMSGLDGSYTVFGQVVSGLDWLERISRAPADSNDCPLERIEVKSVKVFDQKGPLLVLRETPTGGRRYTKPSGAKGPVAKFLERVW